MKRSPAILALAFAFVCSALAVLFVPRAAFAAQAPDVQFSADAEVVGLGDTMHVTMQAMSSGGSPSNPNLGGSPGFAVIGMSPSSSTQMSIVNGSISSQRGLTTVWTLRATKLGTFSIGPSTIDVDGTHYRTHALSVRVVPAGQAPQRQQQQPNVFDPFGGIFGQMHQFTLPGFDPPDPQRQQQTPTPNPKLALDSPRGATYFLHATIDKPSAVVGEQVTFSVYVYKDASYMGRDVEANDPHEVPADDFQKRQLLADDSKLPVDFAMVGDKLYVAELLRRYALFPLKTGDLDIGQMSLQFGSGNSGAGGVRKSEDLHVHVSEPPVTGRPPGYAVGDVGQFTLSADVTGAKNTEQEGAIGVTVTLSGTGNLPASLTPPERAGVEWLDPQITEKLALQKGTDDKFGGTRTFQYVVRMHRAGDVDLGDFTLPYWNPQSRAYETARAPLGSIHVTPSATPAPPPEVATDPLPNLPAVRTALENSRTEHRYLDDAPAFWLTLGAMPLAYAVVVAAAGTARRVRQTRAAQGASPHTELRRRVQAAEEAARGTDERAIDAATARALAAATIAGRGVNVRGLTAGEVSKALIAGGASEADAAEVESILAECEAGRFSGGAQAESGGGARERWARARKVVERLAGRT